jgi:hypothetical protein
MCLDSAAGIVHFRMAVDMIIEDVWRFPLLS